MTGTFKTVAPTLNIGSLRLPLSDAGRLHAAVSLDALGLGEAAHWARAGLGKPALGRLRTDPCSDAHPQRFWRGAGTDAERGRIRGHRPPAWTPHPPAAFSARMADTFARALTGDIRLAAEVAERSSEPLSRSWLHARLESQDAPPHPDERRRQTRWKRPHLRAARLCQQPQRAGQGQRHVAPVSGRSSTPATASAPTNCADCRTWTPPPPPRWRVDGCRATTRFWNSTAKWPSVSGLPGQAA